MWPLKPSKPLNKQAELRVKFLSQCPEGLTRWLVAGLATNVEDPSLLLGKTLYQTRTNQNTYW